MVTCYYTRNWHLKLNTAFFVRGGNSIDKKYRTPKFDWWPEEELSFAEGTKALELYESLKPEIVSYLDIPEGGIQDYEVFGSNLL